MPKPIGRSTLVVPRNPTTVFDGVNPKFGGGLLQISPADTAKLWQSLGALSAPSQGPGSQLAAALDFIGKVDWSLAVAPPSGIERDVLEQIYGRQVGFVPHGQEGDAYVDTRGMSLGEAAHAQYQATANALSVQLTLVWIRHQLAAGATFRTSSEVQAVKDMNSEFQRLYSRPMLPSEETEFLDTLDWKNAAQKRAQERGLDPRNLPELSPQAARALREKTLADYRAWVMTPDAQTHWLSADAFLQNAFGNAQLALIDQVADKRDAVAKKVRADAEKTFRGVFTNMLAAYRQQPANAKPAAEAMLLEVFHRAQVSPAGRAAMVKELAAIGITKLDGPKVEKLSAVERGQAAAQVEEVLHGKHVALAVIDASAMPWDSAERYADVVSRQLQPVIKKAVGTSILGAGAFRETSRTLESVTDTSATPPRVVGFRTTVEFEVLNTSGSRDHSGALTVLTDRSGRLLSSQQR